MKLSSFSSIFLSAVAFLVIYVLASIDAAAGFEPHALCLLTAGTLGRILVAIIFVTHLIVGVCYAIIPAGLAWLAALVWRSNVAVLASEDPASAVQVRAERRALVVVFSSFGMFILACGTGHFVDALDLWVPIYDVYAAVNIVTAIASIATVIVGAPILARVTQQLKQPGVARSFRDALLGTKK